MISEEVFLISMAWKRTSSPEIMVFSYQVWFFFFGRFCPKNPMVEVSLMGTMVNSTPEVGLFYPYY